MLYLCEVTDVDDPLDMNRVRAYILADTDLGESEWMFCATGDPAAIPVPAVGDLVWASLVNAERNVFAWHSLVAPDKKDVTLNEYTELNDLS